MRNIIAIFLVTALVAITACSKSNVGAPLNPNGDNTTAWIGTYTGSVGGTNTVNRVIVSKTNNSSVNIQLQTNVLGGYYTYATIVSAGLTTTTNATINEDGLIAGYTDIYHFAGSAVLNGNTLTISGSAANKNNSSDVKAYYFNGTK
jgi:heat shock protein HslJ